MISGSDGFPLPSPAKAKPDWLSAPEAIDLILRSGAYTASKKSLPEASDDAVALSQQQKVKSRGERSA